MARQHDRMLLVHSDREVATTLQRALEARGYENIRCCEGAEEVLRVIEDEPTTLVVSDVQLDGLNGFQLCRLLTSRAYRKLGEIAVILLRADVHDSRAVSLAEQAGAAAFVETSGGAAYVAARVDELLEGVGPTGTESPAASDSMRALVATGNGPLADRASRYLTEAGYQVSGATDASGAKRVLRRNDYDLLLVGDDVTSAGDGALIQWIRRHDVDTPVIILRSVADGDRWQQLLSSGADDYVEELFEKQDLRAAHRRGLLVRELANNQARLDASETRLRDSEDRCRRQSGLLRSLMETTGDGIVFCDVNLRTTTLNPAALRIFVTSRDQVVGRPVGELIGLSSVSQLDNFIAKPRGTPGISFVADRVIDGMTRTLSVGLNRRDESDGGPGLLLIVRDITDERKLQSKLAQSQKLDSLGALASGMAHDFNNILATILPNAEMIGSMAADEPRMVERARVIQTAARRGGELTRRLLAFARPRTIGAANADPNASVESTVAMLRETLDRNIWLDVQLAEAAVEVGVEPSQLDHILINLGINARDAMPEGGTLRFKTWVEAMPDAVGSADGKEELVAISVTDSGCGMALDTKERAFDPFFTTKGDSGTGLGLSIASEIIKAARGFIEVDSEPGKGTEFRIYLPSVRKHERRFHPEPKVLQGDHERVLVVDDEKPVRDLVAEMLTRLNYDVSAVAAGAEAVERCRDGAPLDLVVLDMIMPGMDGRETYDALRRLKPNLSILVASGDPENSRTTALSQDGVLVLEKPFSLGDLSVAVRSALDEPPAPMELSRA